MTETTGTVKAISEAMDDSFLFPEVKYATVMPHVGYGNIIIPITDSYKINNENSQHCFEYEAQLLKFISSRDSPFLPDDFKIFLGDLIRAPNNDEIANLIKSSKFEIIETFSLDSEYWEPILETYLHDKTKLLESFVEWATKPHPAFIKDLKVGDRVKYHEVDVNGFGWRHKYFMSKI
ncbi:hypothetical protein [Pseudomonas sp. S1_E04]